MNIELKQYPMMFRKFHAICKYFNVCYHEATVFLEDEEYEVILNLFDRMTDEEREIVMKICNSLYEVEEDNE